MPKEGLIEFLKKREKKYKVRVEVKPTNVFTKTFFEEREVVVKVKNLPKTVNTFTTKIHSMPNDLLYESTLKALLGCLESTSNVAIPSRTQPMLILHDAPGNGGSPFPQLEHLYHNLNSFSTTLTPFLLNLFNL